MERLLRFRRWRQDVLNAVGVEDQDDGTDHDGEDQEDHEGSEDEEEVNNDGEAPQRSRFGRRQDPLNFSDFDDDEEFKGLFG